MSDFVNDPKISYGGFKWNLITPQKFLELHEKLGDKVLCAHFPENKDDYDSKDWKKFSGKCNMSSIYFFDGKDYYRGGFAVKNVVLAQTIMPNEDRIFKEQYIFTTITHSFRPKDLEREENLEAIKNTRDFLHANKIFETILEKKWENYINAMTEKYGSKKIKTELGIPNKELITYINNMKERGEDKELKDIPDSYQVSVGFNTAPTDDTWQDLLGEKAAGLEDKGVPIRIGKIIDVIVDQRDIKYKEDGKPRITKFHKDVTEATIADLGLFKRGSNMTYSVMRSTIAYSTFGASAKLKPMRSTANKKCYMFVNPTTASSKFIDDAEDTEMLGDLAITPAGDDNEESEPDEDLLAALSAQA